MNSTDFCFRPFAFFSSTIPNNCLRITAKPSHSSIRVEKKILIHLHTLSGERISVWKAFNTQICHQKYKLCQRLDGAIAIALYRAASMGMMIFYICLSIAEPIEFRCFPAFYLFLFFAHGENVILWFLLFFFVRPETVHFL